MRSVLPYLWYPFFFAFAIAMFALMLGGGAPLLAALYLPIALVAVSIVVLELLDPERRDWRPAWRDVRADAAFMIVVQVAMPRVLLPVAASLAARRPGDPDGLVGGPGSLLAAPRLPRVSRALAPARGAPLAGHTVFA
jgi:hypothetical protein